MSTSSGWDDILGTGAVGPLGPRARHDERDDHVTPLLRRQVLKKTIRRPRTASGSAKVPEYKQEVSVRSVLLEGH